MRLYSSRGLWSIAELWYGGFALVGLSMLAYGLGDNFKDLRFIVAHMRPIGWLILIAAFAPGPIAHWFSRRVKD